MASKIFWLIFAPSHLIVWLVLLAALLSFLQFRRWARATAAAAAAAILLFGVIPSYVLLLRPLEDRHPRPALPGRIDGIVVLGNGLRADIMRLRGTAAAQDGAARIVAAFEIARLHPEAKVVFAGGSGAVGGAGQDTEAAGARFLFARLGLDPRRLLLESRSRNTMENLVFSRRLAGAAPGQTWLLATSASHMPRALATANRLDWAMLPWPTDYATRPEGMPGFFNVAENLALTDWAVHEWIGLLVYGLRG